MNTFKYFTDLNSSDLQTIPLSTAIHFLESRQPLILQFETTGILEHVLEIPVYEFLPADQPFSKFYFDIDFPRDSLPPSCSETFFYESLPTWVETCFNITQDSIGSICSTPSDKKLSVHITLLYKGERKEIKAAAEKLGSFLATKITGFKPQFVDPAVYGRSQKFRTIFSSKRNQKRFKVPLPAFQGRPLVDSLISVVPDEPFPHPFNLEKQKKLSAKLNWFRAVLNDQRLTSLWADLKNDYDSWYTVGASLWIETSGKPLLEATALNLFLQFTADNKWADEALAKWRRAFVSQEKDLWNKIRKWCLEYCPAVKDLDPVFRGSCDRIVRTLNFSRLEREDTGDLELVTPDYPGTFTTRTQYFLYKQVTENEKFYRWWKEKLETDEGLPFLLCLLDTDPSKTYYLGRLKACEESFGSSLLPHVLPYGRICWDSKNFVEWFVTSFSIEVDEEAKVEIDEEEQKYVQMNYLQLCFDLDSEFTQNLVNLYGGISFVGTKEYRDAAATVRQIIQEEAVYQTQWPYQRILRELFAAVHEDWTFFWLALSKFNKDLLFVERVFHLISNCSDDYAAAETVISLYPYWRPGPGGEIYVYDDTEGFWTTDDKIKLGIITRFVAFLELNGVKGTVNSATMDARRKAVLNFIHNSETVRQKGATEFTETKRSGLFRFLFRNGYYDGIADIFYPKITIQVAHLTASFFTNVNIVFFGKIDNDYIPLNNDLAAMMSEMNEKMFMNMHGLELGEYWKRCLSLALFGVRKKGFFEHVGDTNSGKSTEIDMICQSFGSYVKTGSVQNFVNMERDFRSNERQMGWLIPDWMKRLYMCSERTNIKDTCNTERIKSVASGGKDVHQASQLYEKAQSVEVHFIVSFYINQPLTWDNPKDPALIDRRNVITWFRTYVDQVTDPATQLLKDPETQNWSSSKLRQMAYVHLIIQCFKDLVSHGYAIEREVFLAKPLCLTETDSTVAVNNLTSDEVLEQFLQWVVVTGDESHTIAMNELEEVFTRDMEMLAKKQIAAMKNHLQTFGCLVESKQVRKNSLRYRVLTGMYIRSNKAQEYSLLADFAHWRSLMQKHGGKIGTQLLSTLKKVEELIQSSAQLNFADTELITQFASETQKNYFEKHNSFQSFKRVRRDE